MNEEEYDEIVHGGKIEYKEVKKNSKVSDFMLGMAAFPFIMFAYVLGLTARIFENDKEGNE